MRLVAIMFLLMVSCKADTELHPDLAQPGQVIPKVTFDANIDTGYTFTTDRLTGMYAETIDSATGLTRHDYRGRAPGVYATFYCYGEEWKTLEELTREDLVVIFIDREMESLCPVPKPIE